MLIADHASNRVPAGVHLGIPPALLDSHIAIDIGVAALSRALARIMGFPAILGGVSRLVVDLNREATAPHIIPIASDGHAIPGNAIGHRARLRRIIRYWQPYHAEIARQIATQKPRLLISLHSFTPQLATAPSQKRPWQIGILYNQDERAARVAIPALEASGFIVGDQQPYSGKNLNATMNLHGETNGIAYLGIELRQDLIGDATGIVKWADNLVPVIQACSDSLLTASPSIVTGGNSLKKRSR